MYKLILPKHVLDDPDRFIFEKYPKQLLNSLLIAQAFCLENQDYGKEYGLSAINHAIEEGIKNGLF